MTTNILLVGVGGQGAILTARILMQGLVSEGFDVKMSEIHGMSQRGGTVTTQIRFGEKVYAPTISLGEADYILSFEKSEALRAISHLKPQGTLITDDHEIYSLPVSSGLMPYPQGIIEELSAKIKNILVVPAGRIATELGNVKVQNIVILGALLFTLNLNKADWPTIVAQSVPPKAKDVNLKALSAGIALAKAHVAAN
ncbi:MAG: indolepyruvate oxidoreductase subunit beta [Candidatus Adiutrix sp.]